MEFEFVVKHDFGAYRAGNVISDADEVARIEASPRLLANVTRRLAPKPAPAPVVAEPAPAKAPAKAETKA